MTSNSWNQLEAERITIVQDGLDKNPKKWSRVGVMCLLEILWEKYDELTDSVVPQSIIYENATKEMRKNGFNVSKNEVRKKYSNLSATYRRIVAKGGINELKWPYFEIMKEIRKKEREFRLRDKDDASSIGSNSKFVSFSKSHLPSSVFQDLYPPIQREKRQFNNLSTPSGGLAINSADDCLALSNQWETKRFALEDYKMQLLETLFKDVKQQRIDVEEDAAVLIQMRNAKNKHLKQIAAEMTQLRLEVKKELTTLSESVNDLIAALRTSSKQSF